MSGKPARPSAGNARIAASNYTGDLRTQAGGNYGYDAIGNLAKSTAEGITGIGWNVYGKILQINKPTGNITYTYDPSGNRVSKTAPSGISWYVRDAQGNTLAVYNNQGGTINWQEQHLYGSSRLGMWTPNLNVGTGNTSDPVAEYGIAGRKYYELNNHLGNVVATISDRRLQTGGATPTYLPDVISAQDYYSFGMLQPGRQFKVTTANKYRYGFNGKENDNDAKLDQNNNEITGGVQDYGMRIYDPMIGRFFSVDPLTAKYPELTPYQFASNTPIWAIDLDGLEAARPKDSMNPFSRFMQDIGKYIDKQIQKTEAKLYSLSDKDISNITNKAVSSALKRPDKLVLNIVKDVKNQEQEARTDGLNLLYYTASGQSHKASKLAAKMTVDYGVFFLFPEEKELQLFDEGIIEYKSTFKGGAKGDLMSKKNLIEGNHLPTVNGLKQADLAVSYSEASAIQMIFEDHRAFISTGRSRAAQAFRAQEATLLKQGKYIEAFDLNANAIRQKYGNKYDEALNEAREYYKERIVPKLKQTN